MMVKRVLLLMVIIIALPGLSGAANCPDRDGDALIREIDSTWNEAYRKIYCGSLDREVLAEMRSMLDLCTQALAKDPDNYEYLWRYARAAAEYAQTARSLQDEVPEWKDICREWGLKGFRKADEACASLPDRPEAFFWRNYCMGMYVLTGGLEPFITAVREGFLPKSEESVVRGYEADRTYLDYTPVFARAQFLSHLPSVPFLVKGTRKSRFKEAMGYYDEYETCTRHRIQEVFEWDVCVTYAAEFLLDAIDVLPMTSEEKQQYRVDARELCIMGTHSPRPPYVRTCQAMLDNPRNWQ